VPFPLSTPLSYPNVYAFPDIDSNEAFMRNLISPTSPPEATSTPQQSLRMSFGSSFPSQSSMRLCPIDQLQPLTLIQDLLDQDSEMQRVIGDAGSYEENMSHSELSTQIEYCISHNLIVCICSACPLPKDLERAEKAVFRPSSSVLLFFVSSL
jgi:hypothetical protein